MTYGHGTFHLAAVLNEATRAEATRLRRGGRLRSAARRAVGSRLIAIGERLAAVDTPPARARPSRT